ncbi:MAG: thioredoxin domain-containing protein, partial [Fibrella sp.]|nr:thioredoxin domain-containing protein [Armatimonadota bacterium]
MSDSPHQSTNRLAHEKSPYLLQHAHNPVDWFPWGEEALEKARTENKPIFLSIGYSACHWCHVMERESFEKPEIAALVNRYFVPIKVDREERPDVDEIYMTAVQRMTGSGGWPLSVFLLPDGRPFYGGTYFPPEGRHGRIAFPSLVTQLGEAFHNRRDEIEEVAASIMNDLGAATRQKPLPHTGAIHSGELLAGAVAELAERFDAANGGFGSAPKFPPHHALRLLLCAVRDGDDDAVPLLTATLDKMALGGIYDHVGGGFHRYATDAIWLLPHFEKMLYDNALLLRVYAEAGELLDNPAYARIARETADWCLRDLLHSGTGGFEAALDADSEGVEGKYYVWTTAEVHEILGYPFGEAFAQTYQFDVAGNFREEATGHRTGANIPHLSIGAKPLPLPAELSGEMLRARETLLARRYERVPPGKDDKIITAWNGILIGALAFAGKSLGEERYLAAARRAAQCALTTLKPKGELLRRYAKGEAAIAAYLDDYAFLADGLLDLADATGETGWADEARSLTDTLLETFWDATDGGFFYSGTRHETLIAQSKDFFDGNA